MEQESTLIELLKSHEESLKKACCDCRELQDEAGYDTELSEAMEAKDVIQMWKMQKQLASTWLEELSGGLKKGRETAALFLKVAAVPKMPTGKEVPITLDDSSTDSSLSCLASASSNSDLEEPVCVQKENQANGNKQSPSKLPEKKHQRLHTRNINDESDSNDSDVNL